MTAQTDELKTVLSTRRRMLGLRIAVGLMIVLCYFPEIGLGRLLAWFGCYIAVQLLEILAMRAWSDSLSGWRRATVLALLSLGSAVFGWVTLPMQFHLGSFGLGCSAFLVAGALLTTVQATWASPSAFIALGTPFFVYGLILPLWAARPGQSSQAVVGFELGALLNLLYATSMWQQARRANLAQIAAAAELTQSEAQARADRNFLDAVIEHMPAMLIVKDAATRRYRMVNRVAETMLGRERAALVGAVNEDMFAPEQAAAVAERDACVAATRAAITPIDTSVLTPAGERTLRIHKTLLESPGEPDLILVMGEDVTETRATEHALARALEAAEAASRAKTTFLATMSHEVRTPLNGVLGMTQVMAADELSPRQRERLEIIRQTGDVLLAILNDVLDLSKIEAGKLELDLTDFDLGDLVKGVRASFCGVAHEKGLSFDLAVEAEAQGLYRGDSVRLRQILYNLIWPCQAKCT